MSDDITITLSLADAEQLGDDMVSKAMIASAEAAQPWTRPEERVVIVHKNRARRRILTEVQRGLAAVYEREDAEPKS